MSSLRSSCLVLVAAIALLASLVESHPSGQPLECESRTDPCAYTLCRAGSSCRVTASGQAECICNKACTKIYQPVCGSDGRTYSNLCVLQAADCETTIVGISPVSEGPCPTKQAPVTEKSKRQPPIRRPLPIRVD